LDLGGDDVIFLEKERGKKRENIRPISIPSTNLSLTFRSTFFAASLVASMGPFFITNEVEKALGAKLVRATRSIGVVLVRNDILIVCLCVEVELGWIEVFGDVG
jgi:hypothetical protein